MKIGQHMQAVGERQALVAAQLHDALGDAAVHGWGRLAPGAVPADDVIEQGARWPIGRLH